jgi:hypothetical protein
MIILIIIVTIAIIYGAISFGAYLERETYRKNEWYRKIFKS